MVEHLADSIHTQYGLLITMLPYHVHFSSYGVRLAFEVSYNCYPFKEAKIIIGLSSQIS